MYEIDDLTREVEVYHVLYERCVKAATAKICGDEDRGSTGQKISEMHGAILRKQEGEEKLSKAST